MCNFQGNNYVNNNEMEYLNTHKICKIVTVIWQKPMGETAEYHFYKLTMKHVHSNLKLQQIKDVSSRIWNINLQQCIYFILT